MFKTKAYENIWWRVENRVSQLAIEGGSNAYDKYLLSEILRAFSRSQDNQMTGSKKLFVNLEPVVLAHLNTMTPRELSHTIHAYSIRSAGNPELYKAFDARIVELQKTDIFDYASLSNLIYYLMFTDNTNEEMWHQVVEHTLNQEEIMPIVYYKPFKFSKFYLQHHFP